MVQINEQDRATSRPLRWADAPERIHPVIERLVQARLLIARDEGGERVLEVAHEALFSAWDRLRAWLDEDRERLRLRERLRRAATEWIEQDQNPGLLVHRGTRLAETEELLAMPRFRLTDAERAYLAACIAEREAAREAERRRADAARVAVATDWLSRDVSIAALVLTEVQRPDDTPFAVSRMNDAIARGLRPIRPTLFEHPSQVLSAFFSPKADWIVTVAQDHTVRIWPLGPRSRSTIQHHSDVLTTVFSPDGTRIITASRDCTAKIQAIDGSTEPLILHHKVPVNLAAFSPDGTHVVTGAEDGLTRVWRSDAPAKPIELGPPGSYKGGTEVNAVAFSLDGGRVLSASGPVVRIWPTGGAKEPLVLIGRHFGGYSERVLRAWFTPDGRHIVAVGSAVRIWPADGSSNPVEYRDLGSAGPFGVSADGRHFVLASSFDGEVWVFSIDRITKPARFPGEPAILSQVSPDGTKIAIVSPDNAVRVRASDGAGEPSVLRHEAAIRSVAFSHDSERVATVSQDGSARVWHADGTGEPLMLWHEGAVNAASFSPDGDTIVTASDDGTARRWWLNGDSLWRSVRGMMNDCLAPEFREMYLGESPDEAQRAHAACEQAHGRSPDATDIPLNNGYGD